MRLDRVPAGTRALPRQLLALTLGLPTALVAEASSTTENLVLEEVVVTAQKRVESLQDVSVAVSVVSGNKLSSADLKNLQEMSQYVPNFYQVATPTSNVVYIRGIGSAPNAGFEQSVGTFIDGIYMGRARQTLSPMFDLARVEVLKGPQSILFGKNTSAGAVSISSQRPEQDFSARVSGLYGTEHERQLQGYINAPLGETAAGRLSLFTSDQNGWVDNAYDGKDGPAVSHHGARLGLAFTRNETMSGYFKYQHTRTEQDGAPFEIFQKSQVTDPDTGTLVPPHLTEIDARQNFRTDYGNSGPLGNNTTATQMTMDNALLQLDMALGEHTLTSITGYSAYQFHSDADLDFTAANVINSTNGREDFSQISQELRVTSPTGEAFEYIAGLYWQRSHVDLEQPVGFQFSTLVPSTALLRADGVRNQTFDQKSETASAFFQGRYAIADDIAFKFGARYSAEEKELDRSIVVTDFDGAVINPLAQALVWDARLNTTPYEARRDRSEEDFSPMLALEWHAGDEIMTYISATRGFKGGGYDSTHANGRDMASLEYEPEKARNFEVGTKMAFLGGRGNLNIALFYTQFDDLQVSIFDGVAAFNVSNAAEATSQGLEIDTRWLVSPDLLVSGSLAWLDYSYDDYAGAPCTNPQLAQRIVDTGHSTGCVNDLSGETVNYAPEWSAALSGTYTLHLSDHLDVVFTLDTNYRDAFYLSADLDPATRQEAAWKVNGRIALTPPDERWEIALIGKNLTDSDTYSASTAVPFGSSNTPSWNIPDFSGTYYGTVDRPRSVALQFSYTFR